jgi:hypothetical protein
MYIEILATCVIKANGKSGLVEASQMKTRPVGTKVHRTVRYDLAMHNPAPHYTTLHNPTLHNSACKQLGP